MCRSLNYLVITYKIAWYKSNSSAPSKMLTVSIPQGAQFSTFDNDSFIGNTGLCGSLLSKKCYNPNSSQHEPPDSSSEEDEDIADVIGWVIRLLGYASGSVVGVVLGQYHAL
ncbi:hypothetical protein Droror1_Dr00000913 [Drosera rotundifolia]